MRTSEQIARLETAVEQLQEKAAEMDVRIRQLEAGNKEKAEAAETKPARRKASK